MKRKIFFGTLLLMIAVLFFWRATFLQQKKSSAEIEPLEKPDIQTQGKMELPVLAESEEKTSAKEVAQTIQTKKEKVPFTSQAPLGNWNDQRFQDGCEEASIAMAMRWIKQETFSSSTDAKQEILNIAKFEEKTFGHFVDTDVADVARIMSELYGFKDYAIKKTFVLDDLKSELEKGNIILVPAYGRALKNPNFTQPGPIAHMLVIVGYDEKTREFITNDPGTKRGDGYRYGEKVLLEAIWAYPSGKDHSAAPKSTASKAMLIVSKK